MKFRHFFSLHGVGKQLARIICCVVEITHSKAIKPVEFVPNKRTRHSKNGLRSVMPKPRLMRQQSSSAHSRAFVQEPGDTDCVPKVIVTGAVASWLQLGLATE